MERLINRDAEKRPSAEAVLAALEKMPSAVEESSTYSQPEEGLSAMVPASRPTAEANQLERRISPQVSDVRLILDH